MNRVSKKRQVKWKRGKKKEKGGGGHGKNMGKLISNPWENKTQKRAGRETLHDPPKISRYFGVLVGFC